MLKLLNKISSQSPWFIILTGIIWLLVVGFFDYVIIANISLSVFYSYSIFVSTWSLGKYAGFLFSFLSSISWFLSEINAQKSQNILTIEWNAFVRLIFFLIITYLLTEIRQSHEREKSLARTDKLTGLWNRFYFLELLDREVKRFQREPRSFTLAYIDVDNFKNVNDTWGHSRGDQLLVLIAKVLEENLREIDVVARLGGDEFVVLLPETNNQTGKKVLQRVQSYLLNMIGQQSLSVGFSIGAITFYRLPESINEILEKTDQLMYEVKQTGKNRLNLQAYPK